MTAELPPATPSTPAGSGGLGAAAAGAGSQTQVSLGQASLEQLPEKLRNLIRTIILTGTVGEFLNDGAVRLRTQAGDVTLRLPVELPADRIIALQIPPGNPPAKAQVFLVGPSPVATHPGNPPTSSAAALPSPSQPSSAATVQASIPAPMVLTPGTVVATVIVATAPPTAPPQSSPPPPNPGASSQPPATAPAPEPSGSGTGAASPRQPGFPPVGTGAAGSSPQLRPGTLVEIRIVSLPSTSSDSQTARAPAPSPSPSPSPSLPLPTSSAGALKGTVTSPTPISQPVVTTERAAVVLPTKLSLPAGSQVPLSSPPPIPPPPLPSPPPTTIPAGALKGTVTGTTPSGQPVVTTERGVVVVQAKLPLPAGSQVLLSLPLLPPPPAALTTAPLDPHQGRDWPALREAVEMMARIDPGAAKAFAQSVLPQPNGRLAAMLAGFLRHLRGGDIKGWLGDQAMQTLEAAGRRDLLDRLEGDFQKLAQQSKEPLPGEWRSFSIPITDGREFDRVRLLVRDTDPDEEDATRKRSGGASRFLIDLELSRLGSMQLDGLVRQKRFDLILRTKIPLSADMRQDIKRIFIEAVDSLGMSGIVSFQAGSRNWVIVQTGSSGSHEVIA